MKTIIYCRVSSLSQNTFNKSISLQNQECICNKYAHEQDIKVSSIYKEVNSAYNKIPSMLGNIINLKNTIIIIMCVDRFSRSLPLGIQMLQTSIKNNNKIIFIRENLQVSKNNHIKLLIPYLNMTQLESKLISNRAILSKQYLRSKGMFLGGSIPYGYKVYKRKLVPTCNEQNVIEFINICKQNHIDSSVINQKMRAITKIQPYEIINCYNEECCVVKFITEKLTNVEIANLLNSYNVYKRGTKWTGGKVNSVYKHVNKSTQPNNILNKQKKQFKKMRRSQRLINCGESQHYTNI
jgi:DNA invertase Pin-like site-specific DNA recombinase